jgi:putative nucleotidyltransferase with HDIG domain
MKEIIAELVENTIHILDPDILLIESKKYLQKLSQNICSVIIYVYDDNSKNFCTTYNHFNQFYVPIGIGPISLCFISRDIVTNNLSIFYPMNNNLGVIQFNYVGDFSKDGKDLLQEGVKVFNTILQNALNYNDLKESFDSFVDVLGLTIDARDYITSGHSKRTALYVEEMSKKLRTTEPSCKILKYGALLHDIGKITVSERILFKNGKLSETEFKEIKKHPTAGMELLMKAKLPKDYRNIPQIIEAHHERYDGTGYPKGLIGEEIPIEARIIAICDVFDALTSFRQYRDTMSFDEALSLMTAEKGQFDPKLLNIFLRIPYDVLNIIDKKGR